MPKGFFKMKAVMAQDTLVSLPMNKSFRDRRNIKILSHYIFGTSDCCMDRPYESNSPKTIFFSDRVLRQRLMLE